MASTRDIPAEVRAKVLTLTEDKVSRKEIAAATGLTVYAVYKLQQEAKA